MIRKLSTTCPHLEAGGIIAIQQVALPKRSPRLVSAHGINDDPVPGNFLDQPLVAAQKKNVPNARFEDKLFLHFTKLGAVPQIDAIVSPVGNGTAVGGGQQTCTTAPHQPVVDFVPGYTRLQSGNGIVSKLAGQHLYDVSKSLQGKTAIAVALANQTIKLVS